MRGTFTSLALISLFSIPAIGLTEPLEAKSAKALDVKEVKKLLPVLRHGGYVLYMRHAETNQKQEDQRPVDLANCNTQRNLSEEGKKQASTIGSALRKLSIPIGNVFSSPFCRCKETAELAFKAAVLDENLYFAMDLNIEGKKAKGSMLKKMLAATPDKGKNNVYVSHTANLQEALGYWPKPEAVIYIFKPNNGAVETIGFVTPDIWSNVIP